jgi:hypothetical protein
MFVGITTETGPVIFGEGIRITPAPDPKGIDGPQTKWVYTCGGKEARYYANTSFREVWDTLGSCGAILSLAGLPEKPAPAESPEAVDDAPEDPGVLPELPAEEPLIPEAEKRAAEAEAGSPGEGAPA